MEQLIARAEKLLKESNAKSFALSTRIDDRQMMEEEKEFDLKLTESIKARMNKEISEKLSKATGARYDSMNGQVRIVIDLIGKKVSIENEPLFIFGRYKKLVAGVSQSRWICSKCEGDGCFKCDYTGKKFDSVEEALAEPFKEACDAKDYSLHASGREDVDAINTAGRPFVLELVNPQNRHVDLKTISEKINSGGKVIVEDLKLVLRQKVELVTESHFDKEYVAETEFSRNLSQQDIDKLKSIEGMVISQHTPVRVAHRRADLERKRKVLFISVDSWDKNTAKIRILAEAGTYIKELISGDKGRTKPSISELLNCDAKCKYLTVSKIYDDYLKMLGL